ncbi:hypothetical protein EYB26_004963 [Talaromyces marneffei]|uniref:uncharacterized protein n=1 Tax=Talaromyces marneffei TaxID=37727 RepID=UPI0012A9D52C|nr:uncharacterized protein EYB26_004963 [Talaromyces marneffei]QGA17292.1 hypothetical protein EYB26_004963 [Talaromyces marneffei]
MDEQSTSPTHIMERYSQYVHHWLPIIDLHRISSRIKSSHMLEAADAELASLLLCIHIASQPSSAEMREQYYMQRLYIQSQRIFACLQSIRKFSIETIQCGLLLAVYQIGAGLLSDAYVTLSTTTGLARAGQLLTCHKNTHDGDRSHEARVVWWAIFLLGRILALASLPNHLPLLMEQPRDFEDLPDIHILRPSPEYEGDNQPYEYFKEELQAAYLTGKTLYYMSPLHESSESELEKLNGEIITRLGDMFAKAPGSWRPFCSAIAILLVTAVELQFTRLTNTAQDKEASSSCLQAISTHIKITIDIARNYLEDEDTNFATDIVPITGVISDYHTLVAIFRQRDLGHEIATDDSEGLIVLKRSLNKKSNLWDLADKYIQDLSRWIMWNVPYYS